ncbi:MAG: shikimate kinase [Sphingomonadaceae bacterium]
MNVVLIGFSGSGKSSVGRLLALRLGWELIDTDAEVERMAGKRIHQIFAEEGEAGFRRLESEAVLHALVGERRVVAVGGGAVVDPANREAMRKGNLVVLLDAGVETLHRRLAAAVVAEPRPMLGAEDGERAGGEAGRACTSGGPADPPAPADPVLARIAALKAQRDPIYRETAHLSIWTEGLDVESIADRVAEAVGAACSETPDTARQP